MQPPSCVMVFAYLALIGSLLVVVTAAIPAKEAASDVCIYIRTVQLIVRLVKYCTLYLLIQK